MLKQLIKINLLFLTLLSYNINSYAQDYKKFAKLFYGSDNAKNIDAAKNLIEKTNSQKLAIQYIKLYEDLLKNNKDADREIKLTEDNFDKEYIHPDKKTSCKNFKKYNDLYKLENNRSKTTAILVNAAKTAYDICKNNAFRTTNCAEPANNYNRQLAIYNNAVSKADQHYNTLKRYYNSCRPYQDRYNKALSNHNKKIKNLRAKYLNNDKNLRSQYQSTFNQLNNIIKNNPQPYKEYYDNGKVKMEGTVFNGAWTGITKYYFKNGNLKMEGKLSGNINQKSNGVGIWKYYYENGKLKSKGKLNRNGNQEGIWEVYYQNGNKNYIGEFLNNKKEGYFKYYHENTGKIKFEGLAKNDKLEGIWKVYDENGKLKSEEYYINSKSVSKEVYEKNK